MHPHLHTERTSGECCSQTVSIRVQASLLSLVACEDLIAALEECHARGLLWKSMGMCGGAKDQLSKCLKGERTKQLAVNQSSSGEKKQKIKQLWEEVDRNS
jgi:COX assembly protein 2